MAVPPDAPVSSPVGVIAGGGVMPFAVADSLEKRGTPEASTIERREARKLSPKSVNHWLEIVSAILRTGWRNA